MDVREHDLPGVGKKFACMTNEGARMTIIIHNTGHREIYHFKKGEDYPFYAVRLDDQEARKLGAILGGAYFQPPVAESMDMVFEQLSLEWVRIEPGSPLVGESLAEARVRERTGASVIALLRGERALPNPAPTETIQEGDLLLGVGHREQVAALVALVRPEPPPAG